MEVLPEKCGDGGCDCWEGRDLGCCGRCLLCKGCDEFMNVVEHFEGVLYVFFFPGRCGNFQCWYGC